MLKLQPHALRFPDPQQLHGKMLCHRQDRPKMMERDAHTVSNPGGIIQRERQHMEPPCDSKPEEFSAVQRLRPQRIIPGSAMMTIIAHQSPFVNIAGRFLGEDCRARSTRIGPPCGPAIPPHAYRPICEPRSTCCRAAATDNLTNLFHIGCLGGLRRNLLPDDGPGPQWQRPPAPARGQQRLAARVAGSGASSTRSRRSN